MNQLAKAVLAEKWGQQAILGLDRVPRQPSEWLNIIKFSSLATIITQI